MRRIRTVFVLQPFSMTKITRLVACQNLQLSKHFHVMAHMATSVQHCGRNSALENVACYRAHSVHNNK